MTFAVATHGKRGALRSGARELVCRDRGGHKLTDGESRHGKRGSAAERHEGVGVCRDRGGHK